MPPWTPNLETCSTLDLVVFCYMLENCGKSQSESRQTFVMFVLFHSEFDKPYSRPIYRVHFALTYALVSALSLEVRMAMIYDH